MVWDLWVSPSETLSPLPSCPNTAPALIRRALATLGLLRRANPPKVGSWGRRAPHPPAPNSRHDAGEVEELRREVGHVAVEEDEEGLDDADVGGEAGREGSNQPINDAHEDAAQRHHEEAEEAKDDIDNGHLLKVGKLLKKVVEDLGMRREKGFQTEEIPSPQSSA